MNAHRLYVRSKRRRVVSLKKSMISLSALLAVVMLSLLIGSNLVVAHGNTQDEPISHKYYKSIEVVSGDTLWDIAKRFTDGSHSDVTTYIKELKQINNLHSDDIHDSQYLTVAYYDTTFQ